MNTIEKDNPKQIKAWIMYDWANSAYSLVVVSVIFPLYYSFVFEGNNYINLLGIEVKNTALITLLTALSFLIIAALAPLLAGIADFTKSKKYMLRFFMYLGALSCIGLYWFTSEHLFIGFCFYSLGLIGFWGSLVFYNSYLPDIVSLKNQDNVSARGYAAGYIGSVILLLLNLVIINKPQWFFIIKGNSVEMAMMAMRISFVTVGLWWIIFSRYVLRHLPNFQGYKAGNKKVIMSGFSSLLAVFHEFRSNQKIKRFLLSFFIYGAALQTVMLVATYFGEEEIAWGSTSNKTFGLIVSIMLIQLIAVVGAMATSYMSRKKGNITTLFTINIIWMGICAYAYFIVNPWQFYVAAALVGLVMGGLQALSRSTYSKLLPATSNTTSYFSFYDMVEKISIVIGMALFGLIDQLTGSMRNAIVFLTIMFLSGALLLLRLPKKLSEK